jgi:hypothetical protein
LKKKNASLHEDGDGTVEAITHVNIEVNMATGLKTKHIKVPLFLAAEECGAATPTTQANLHISPEWDIQNTQEAKELMQAHIRMVRISLIL